MNFEYYYGNQAEQFSFIKIPKIMITDETFSDLSLPAKVLYGLLLDRMSLSMKNRWFDSENRVYIIYQIADIQEDLGISKNKAIDLLAALEKFGLVEKRRTEIVRSRFLKLNYSHIQYVLLCLQKNTTKVKNIKKYMLATLFNAPCTIEGYYQAEVNHDFPQYVR